MDRLLVLRLEALGCSAEALINGIPVARVGGQHRVVTLPIHEFTLAGPNEIEMVINPGVAGMPATPEPWLADGQACASLQLLLPRTGGLAHPSSARSLAQLGWMPGADEVVEMPARLHQGVDLPIAFPRWRWLDAPVMAQTPTLKAELAAFLLEIAVGLAKGNPEPLIQASRLRLEDLALAYQRPMAEDVARFRLHLQQLHAAQPLKPALPSSAKMLLRPVAGGRLTECLNMAGEPLLQSARAEGGHVAWPLRIAAVDGQFYVLR